MKGKIIKGIAGFYYVKAEDGVLYECKAKGIFRKEKIKPLVGDCVEIQCLDGENRLGNIEQILPRDNALIRPAVANVDQALVVFASVSPAPNLNLLDRFLMMMEKQQIPVTICFNKTDLAKEPELEKLKQIYSTCGYPISFISVREKTGIESIRAFLRGKTTVLAGPSGVGKSSLLNLLYPEADMEIGSISEKIQRGKHTTRHSEFFCTDKDTYLLDTPGFSSMTVDGYQPEELQEYFPEFQEYLDGCRFIGCSHVAERDCGIKEAVADGKISQSRYDNYVLFYRECKDRKKY